MNLIKYIKDYYVTLYQTTVDRWKNKAVKKSLRKAIKNANFYFLYGSKNIRPGIRYYVLKDGTGHYFAANKYDINRMLRMGYYPKGTTDLQIRTSAAYTTPEKLTNKTTVEIADLMTKHISVADQIIPHTR